jgi:hypothetical protein
MPIDLSVITDSLQRGFGQIPPIAIALVLLAGPTAALIGYRLIGVARRMQTSPEVEAAPLWVCHDCRSVNEFRVSRCYRCGTERDAAGELEVIVDQPAARPSTFETPVGSPFAALGAAVNQGTPASGVPVMADPSTGRDAVAVGPGRPVETGVMATGTALPITGKPAPEPAEAGSPGELRSAVERRP